MKNTGEVRNSRLVRSAFVFAACYVVLLVVMFLMIVINDPAGWTRYFVENVADILTLCVCTFLLCFIIYYYYYFEDKAFLVKVSNVVLVFSLVTVCVIASYLFGRFVNIYARPSALLALLCVFLFNRRQAIMLNFIFSILMFVIDTYTNNFAVDGATTQVYYSLMLNFVCGTFAIFAVGKNKTRGGLLLTGCVIAIPTVIIVTLLQVTAIYTDWIAFIAYLGYSIMGCLVSAALALAVMPVFEACFNRLTVFRLRELTSTNAPLLVRLKQEERYLSALQKPVVQERIQLLEARLVLFRTLLRQSACFVDDAFKSRKRSEGRKLRGTVAAGHLRMRQRDVMRKVQDIRIVLHALCPPIRSLRSFAVAPSS